MASEWNLWVWLECIGVVSGCCCKEVYRYPHNNYNFSLYTPLVLAPFLAAASILLCSFFFNPSSTSKDSIKVNNRTYITTTENFTFT